jgi:hypothetical protein
LSWVVREGRGRPCFFLERSRFNGQPAAATRLPLLGAAGNGTARAATYITVFDRRRPDDTGHVSPNARLKEARMFEQFQPQLSRMWRVGYAADPAIDILLDKSRIAQIKVRQLEMAIREMEGQIELAKLELNLLKEEYKIRGSAKG